MLVVWFYTKKSLQYGELRLKLKGKLNLPLKAKELEPALIEAEYLYADARCMSRDHPLV